VKMRNMSLVAGLSFALVSGFWAACLAQTASEGPGPATQPSVTATAAPAVTLAPASQPAANASISRRDLGPRMTRSLGGADISGLSARQALNWWSNASGINLVINWDELAKEGIDPDKAVDVHLHGLSAEKVLAALLEQAGSNEQVLMGEKKDGYIQVVTKAYADAHPVLRMYDVEDLLMEAPDFLAADIDLNAALGGGNNNNNNSNSNNNGNSNGNNNTRNSLFGQTNNGQSNNGSQTVVSGKTKQERGDELAKLIRDLIEPTIWVENGGQLSTCRYAMGRLIVKAPLYVHDQIGTPLPVPKS
jgi:hypothetical protein